MNEIFGTAWLLLFGTIFKSLPFRLTVCHGRLPVDELT